MFYQAVSRISWLDNDVSTLEDSDIVPRIDLLRLSGRTTSIYTSEWYFDQVYLRTIHYSMKLARVLLWLVKRNSGTA